LLAACKHFCLSQPLHCANLGFQEAAAGVGAIESDQTAKTGEARKHTAEITVEIKLQISC
jgi:hypothetical protein